MDPVKPSVLRSGVPKELETICLKCLQKSPKDRYLTVTDLLEDLDRFLDGRPILARPASLASTAWKWTKRHPAVAALIAVTALASTSVLVIGLAYNASLRNALSSAKAAQARADGNLQFAFQAVEQMLERVGFSKLADTPEMEGIREELMSDAVGFYSKMLESQPSVDVDSRRQYYTAMARLGRIQWTLGQTDSALRNLQRAIDSQQRLSTEYPDRLDIQHEVAVSMINQGLITRKAEDFRSAIGILEAISEGYPISKRELAQARNNLANVADSMEERERLHLSVLELRRELLQESPNDASLLYGFGETQHNLGFIYNITGRVAESEAAYREALQVFERLVSEYDTVTDYRNALAETITHVSEVVHSRGRADEAVALIDRGIAIRKLAAARFPRLPAMHEAVVRGLLTKAAFLIQTSQFALATQASQEAVDICNGLIDRLNGVHYQFLEATSLTILATALSGDQKLAEAKEVFERANVTYNKVLEADPANVQYLTEAGVQFMNFSNVLRQEDPTRAALFNDRSTALLEKAVERFPERTDYQSYLFNAHGARASSYEVLGDFGTAADSWSRAFQLAPPERRFEIGLLKALALARGGKHREAVDACKDFIDRDGMSGADLYNLACVYGVADKVCNATPIESDSKRESYCDSAIGLLSRPETIEFLRIPENRQQLMVDADLETVRKHNSFESLASRLSVPQD